MKTLLILAAVLGFAIPLSTGCSHEVAHEETTKRDWKGDVSHKETTVKENDLTGSTTIEKKQSQY